MPHIKAKPIRYEQVVSRLQRCEIVRFIAKPCGKKSDGVLLGVACENERFLLLLRLLENETLLKFEKLTRPLNLNTLKKALRKVAQALELEITSSNVVLHESRSRFASEYEKRIDFFEDPGDFGFDKVSLEVGFGSGKHLLYQARKNSDTLFIGLEIHTPSALQVLKQIKLQSLENIWVVNYDARLFLEMLPSNLLSKIYVHFPVPWDKKPHRRVISKDFLKESLRTLTPGGKLELRTDSVNYFRYALEIFSEPETIRFEVRKNETAEVISKYEARWRRLEKDIYDIIVVSNTRSPERKIEGDFNFDIVKYNHGSEDKLARGTQVYEGYFVHIERLYSIDDNKGLLIKLSLGSFDRPEHTYVILDESGCRYYPRRPVKTPVNLRAHRALKALLSEALKP